MSRIRSVHPGLYTDEAFMSASMAARMLFIGIWCEAWDDGVFEWKPMTLKVRLFPADSIDVGSLLSELAGLNMVRRFEAGGKQYGAVRNFQRFQKPKKPNSSNVLPNEFRAYVGRDGTGSEPVPHQYGTGSEPVRNGFGTVLEPVPLGEEDGGEDGEESSAASASNEATAAAAPPDPIPAKPPASTSKPTGDPPSDPADDPDADPEGWFWAQAPALAERGVARSRLGNLVQLHSGDWRSLVPTLRDVIAANNPSSYLGAIVANLKAEQAPPEQQAQPPPRRGRSSGEPDFVRAARAEGLHVAVGKRGNGRPSYIIGREVFDEHGNVTGF